MHAIGSRVFWFQVKHGSMAWGEKCTPRARQFYYQTSIDRANELFPTTEVV
jgi:hypothetical protein